MKIVEERDPQTYAIIGAAMEIHRQLGYGFLESVYQEAATIEFPLKGVPFAREVALPITEQTLCVFPKSLWNLKRCPGYQTWKRLKFSTI